jgi:hypothetical protein
MMGAVYAEADVKPASLSGLNLVCGWWATREGRSPDERCVQR